MTTGAARRWRRQEALALTAVMALALSACSAELVKDRNTAVGHHG